MAVFGVPVAIEDAPHASELKGKDLEVRTYELLSTRERLHRARPALRAAGTGAVTVFRPPSCPREDRVAEIL